MTTPTAGAGLNRRQFLQLGAAGTFTLAAFGSAATLSGCRSAPPAAADGYRWLADEDLALFSALLPVANGTSMPADQASRDEALRRIDLAMAALEPPAQAETRKLLDLLHWAPFRRLACGVTKPWTDAAPGELATFLQRWRDSRLALFNAGYRGLVKLAQLGWWSQPASWSASRYPGPPAWAVTALNG